MNQRHLTSSSAVNLSRFWGPRRAGAAPAGAASAFAAAFAAAFGAAGATKAAGAVPAAPAGGLAKW